MNTAKILVTVMALCLISFHSIGAEINTKQENSEKQTLNCSFCQFHAGIVTGPNAAFYIAAPDGWGVDNKSGLSQGLNCVIYPRGRTWTGSPVKMYAKIASAQYDKKEDFYSYAIDSYSKSEKDFAYKTLMNGKTSEGFDYTTIEYNRPESSQYELAAYIQVPDAVIYIVFTAQDVESRETYSGSFNEAVKSFLYKPEHIRKSAQL